jgi:sulfur-oxidizing protein SoxY
VSNMKRRTFLKGTLAAGAAGMAVSAGLLTPRAVLAAWPTAAFEAKTVPDALTSLMGSDKLDGSDKITIKAPDIAENGAVVPVSVETSIEGVSSISIISEKNASPLSASFKLGSGTEAFVATRIKLAKTMSVVAVVKSGDKLYSTGKEVKVTIGGCGG